MQNHHIEITPGIAGGKPQIAGHRITVQNVVIWHERMGMSPDEIASEYGLSLAEVHAALAYYFDHQKAIDQSIKVSNAFVEAVKQKTPSKVQQKLQRMEANGEPVPWAVHRQDDNGNQFIVQTGLSREEAERLVAQFDSKGHKQLYWATCERKK